MRIAALIKKLLVCLPLFLLASFFYADRIAAEETDLFMPLVSVTADPGIVAPGGNVKLRLSIDPSDCADLQMHENTWSVSIYVTEKPTSETNDFKQLGDSVLLTSSLCQSGGLTREWAIPKSPNDVYYGWQAKLFKKNPSLGQTGEWVFDSWIERNGRIKAESSGADDTACPDGSGCVASIQTIGYKSSYTAGDLVGFLAQYTDNTDPRDYTYVVSVGSKAGGDADIEKCKGSIDNRGGAQTGCEWKTIAGAGGTESGNHMVKMAVYDQTAAGNPLMAVAFLTVYINNPDKPEPTTPEDPNIDTLRPGDITTGLTHFLSPSGPFGSNTLAGRIVKFFTETIGFLAFIGILVGGFQFLTSGGNTTQTEKAKKTLIYSVIGLVVAVLSYVIITYVINALNCFFGTGGKSCP